MYSIKEKEHFVNLSDSADMWLWAQNKISLVQLKYMFGKDLGEHLFAKWEGEILKFVSRLDKVNRSILIKWVYTNYPRQ